MRNKILSLSMVLLLGAALSGCFYNQFKRSQLTVTKDRTEGISKFELQTAFGVTLSADNDLETFRVLNSTGKELWNLSEIKLRPEDIMMLDAAPILVLAVTEQTSWVVSGTMSAKLKAFTLFGGELLWETESFGGALSGGGNLIRCDVSYPVLLVTGTDISFSAVANIPGLSSSTGSEKVDITILAYDVFTGAPIWDNEIATVWNSYNPVTHEMDYFQMFSYPEPFIFENLYITFYDGVQALDIATGELKLEDEFDVRSGTLEKVYASPKVEDDILYTFSGEQVRAYNLTTLSKKFESDEIGKITSAWIDHNFIYVQYGGYFVDNTDSEWQRETPSGVAKLNIETGDIVKNFSPGEDVIVSVGPVGDDMYMFSADEKSCFALNLNTGNEVWRIEPDMIDPCEELIFTKMGEVAVRSSSQVYWLNPADGAVLNKAPRGVMIGKPSFTDWALLFAGALGKGMQEGGARAYSEMRAVYQSHVKAEKTFLGMSASGLSSNTLKELNKAGVYSGAQAAAITYNTEGMNAVNKVRDKARFDDAMTKIQNELNRAEYLSARTDAGYQMLQKEISQIGTRDYVEIIYWDMTDKTKYKAFVNVNTGEYQSGAIDGFEPAWQQIR